MSFQSLSFPAFLTLTVSLSLAVGRKHRGGAVALLTAACAVFYLWGFDRRALAGFLVLLGGGCVTWAAVSLKRRRGFALAACWHIGCLLWFKCAGFFDPALYQGWMPLGLSFFTFQQLWLLHEASQGRFSLSREDRLGFGLYCFFFPTVTSGPILKPQSFFPQLRGEGFLRPDGQDLAAGLYALSLGFAKKGLLADPLGTVVANGWSRVGDLSAPGAWLVMLAYTLQLYLDFSGYCDIAAGCARLLGIRLPVNFDSPYRALSVGEFWKRWHITLTSFLRECLYFPLGGSRKGAGRTYLNIMLVFLVSGFWHGAGWTFLVWGGLHGLAQVAERLWGARRDRLPRAIRWGMTFLFVNVAWVFFRAPDMTAALELLRTAVCGGLSLPHSWLMQGVLSKEVAAVQLLAPAAKRLMPRLLAVLLLGGGLLASLLPGNTIRRMEDFRPTVWRAAVLSLLLAWSILSFSGVATFIYSNF